MSLRGFSCELATTKSAGDTVINGSIHHEVALSCGLYCRSEDLLLHSPFVIDLAVSSAKQDCSRFSVS
jgi:hypothetical protein